MRLGKDKKLKNGLFSKPFLMDLGNNSNLNSLHIFSEEFFSNPKLIYTKNFNLFSSEVSSESIEDSYDSAKYVNYLYFLNYKNIINGLSSNLQPISYTSVFDSFRSDYEDLYMYSDEIISNSYEDVYSSQEGMVNSSQPLRLSNPLKLRSTVKNAIVTYNAIQKVFRSRFDEGRSNARLEDFSNSYIKHPFLTDNRVSYESMLGKNKEFFFKNKFI
jgi:hypothetical protein